MTTTGFAPHRYVLLHITKGSLGLPGASFIVNGASAAETAALLSTLADVPVTRTARISAKLDASSATERARSCASLDVAPFGGRRDARRPEQHARDPIPVATNPRATWAAAKAELSVVASAGLLPVLTAGL